MLKVLVARFEIEKKKKKSINGFICKISENI